MLYPNPDIDFEAMHELHVFALNKNNFRNRSCKSSVSVAVEQIQASFSYAMSELRLHLFMLYRNPDMDYEAVNDLHDFA